MQHRASPTRLGAVLLALALAGPAAPTARAQAPGPGEIDPQVDDILYGELRKLQTFGSVQVRLRGDDAARIGLRERELTDFLRLRFRNSFAATPFRSRQFRDVPPPELAATGLLWCDVWTVGTDYPVAYHVECQLGSYERPRAVHGSVLGYGSKDTVPRTVREAIDGIVQDFATQYLKVRGLL